MTSALPRLHGTCFFSELDASVGLAGGLAHKPEALRRGFGFSQIRQFLTHSLVPCFQIGQRDRGRMGKEAAWCRFHPRLCKLL